MEKLTVNKAARFIGKTSKQEIDAFKQQFLEETAEKEWLSINDWLWGKLQNMVIDSEYPSSIYYLMAEFVSRFEGKSGLQYSRQAIESALRNKMLGIESKEADWVIEVVGKIKDCEHSCKLDSKQYKFSIEDLNPAQLAFEGKCQRMNCLCEYVIVPNRDKDDLIAFKTSTGKTIKF